MKLAFPLDLYRCPEGHQMELYRVGLLAEGCRPQCACGRMMDRVEAEYE